MSKNKAEICQGEVFILLLTHRNTMLGKSLLTVQRKTLSSSREMGLIDGFFHAYENQVKIKAHQQ